ncbi:PREDICTED: protein hairless-like [Camelina sativa]|uniref:Protein hairless-like n=1 Tax=Camelina sativa TaxID=90675 RepID=A0ABM0XLK2_CAMSA|nr:PREDICTED: protein hairless-like [Camelina sativa]XP_010487738.1 PREDICTED: protein hairless-like [Camelina sativa]
METPLPSLSQQITPNPTSAATVSSAIPAAVKSVVVQQPIDGSPRAVAVDTGGNPEPLAAVPGAKLRLMCSFGGHIMPRPHDKSLTYSGGETRLVVVDRRASLSSLRSRLSSILLNCRSFTLKYQLPSEDLDSLVTITTDEDLENMIEEYDRVTSSATVTATQRIRLFLFANKLETAATMGSLLDGAKSDTWFVDALNQSGLLPRGLSDSAAVNNTLVNLDEASGGDTEIQNLETNAGGENNKRGDLLAPNGVISHQEMHMSSMPDSPMMEAAGSSIGSSSSSPSTSNLPPIRVRVSEDQRIEEQLAHMTFSNMQTQRQFDDGISLMTNRPMMVPSGSMTDGSIAYNNSPSDSAALPSNGQVSPHDDRSDSCVSAGYRKPPLPMQPVTIPPRTIGGYALTSPDSVASDTSISSATSFSKPMYYQDQPPALPKAPSVTQPETTSVQSSHVLPQTETTSPHTTSHIQSQSGTYTTMDQQQHQPTVQQPYLQGVQYIPHASQYFPVYSHQQQNYPVYVMSVPQSQQYVPAGTPPLYPISKPATNSRSEAAQNVYRAAPPHVLQLQQQQHQYMGYTGVPQHTTNANANYGTGVPQHATNANANYSIGAPPQHSTNANTNYGGAYEYTNPPSETVYYHAQPPVANTAIPLASPYQSMTPAAAAAALADMSKQMALDGGNQQQHMAPSQPL